MPFVSIRRKRTQWTPEKDRELLNQWEYGINRRDIAEHLGTTVAALEKRYYKLKKEQADD